MKNLLTFILLFLSTLCTSQSHLERLQSAPIIGENICYDDNSYSAYMCKFTEKDTIKYVHYNKSPVDDFSSVKDSIDSTVVSTFKLANKTAILSPTNPDLVIVYEYIDGIGGVLAQATPPFCDTSIAQKLIYDNYDMPPGVNTPDSIKVLYKNVKNIVTVTKHELGHILGLKHNELNRDYLMYSRYTGEKDWHKDELPFFDLYFNINDFVFFNKRDNRRLSKNFRYSEYFSKCKGLNFHLLHKKLPITVQDLRDYAQAPIYINSTYRHTRCNKVAGGASKSQHLVGRALDFSFKNQKDHDQFVKDIESKGDQYWILLINGITGLGIYDTHIHIDTRTNKEKITVWDYRNSLVEGCGL